MDFILSIFIFVVLLGLLVFIHELGHFLAAVKSGVVVDEFAFGFGPKLYAKRIKGTQYRINAIPLGGYVKMLGDVDASSFKRYTAKKYAKSDKEYALKLLKKNKLDPKKSAYDEIQSFVIGQKKVLAKGDYAKLENYFVFEYIPKHPGNYDNTGTLSKVAIIVAGVVMNFLLAALIFYVMFQFTDYTSPPLTRLGTPPILGGDVGAPPVILDTYAQDLEELEGTIIIEINGRNLVREGDFVQFLQENYNQRVQVVVFTADGYRTGTVVLNGDGVASNLDLDVINRPVILNIRHNSLTENTAFSKGSIIIKINGDEVENGEQLRDSLIEKGGELVNFEGIDETGVAFEVQIILPDDAVTFEKSSEGKLLDKVAISTVEAGLAAENAGLSAGDTLLSLNDIEIVSINQLLELLQENKGSSVEIEYLTQEGELRSTEVTLANTDGGPILGAGLVERDELYSLGIVWGSNEPFLNTALRVTYQDNKLFSGFLHAYNMTAYTVTGIGELVSQSLRERSITPVSQGVSSVVGVASIIFSFVQIRDFLNILNLAGLVSVALGFINILPIPLLDGGNLLFLIIEKVRGRPLSEKRQEQIGKYTFTLLIVLSVLIMLKDVFQFNILARVVNLIGGIFGG